MTLTLAEAAARLGVAASTLRWQIRNGKLKARKIGPLWTVSDREVERYQQEHRSVEAQLEIVREWLDNPPRTYKRVGGAEYGYNVALAELRLVLRVTRSQGS